MLARVDFYHARVVEGEKSRNVLRALCGEGDLQGNLIGGMAHDFYAANPLWLSSCRHGDDSGHSGARDAIVRVCVIGLQVQNHSALLRAKDREQMLILD